VALIEHMDAGVGAVLEKLDALGLAQNTLVVFTSDNGGVLSLGANNGPWRGAKQQMYEGGLRVPCVARWPGRIAPGSRTEQSLLTMDLFATACEVAGVEPPAGIDGRSFLSTLRGSGGVVPGRAEYYVRREGGAAYGGKTIEALREGDWKLLQNSPFAPLELYNLREDPLETRDVAGKEKAVFERMSAALRVHVQRGGVVPWQPADGGAH
jgi:arylsulfatase A-like enzyme